MGMLTFTITLRFSFASYRSRTYPSTNGTAPTNGNVNSARTPCHAGVNTSETGQVPVISITYASDEPDTEGQTISPHAGRPDSGRSLGLHRTPRVYVCCVCNHRAKQDTLHKHVLHALQHEFYVRSGPCADDKHGPRWDDLREADACVFVLDDPSLKTTTCFEGLGAAWAFDIPTVFLKDSNYALPTPLPDFILQHNLGLGTSPTSRASTSAREGATPEIGLDTRGILFSSPATRASSVTSIRSQRRSHRRTKQGLRDSDMVLHLLNGYRDALVFEEGRHEDCEGELRKAVHSLLGTGRNEMSGSRKSSRPTSKSPNSLHPLSKRTGSFRRHRRTLLGVPRVSLGVPFTQAATSNDLFGDDDDDDGFVYPSSPSEISISPEYSSHFSSSESNLSPSPIFMNNVNTPDASRSNSPSAGTQGLNVTHGPALHIAPATPPPPPTTSPSGRSSGGSFIHLHQRLQQYRASVYASASYNDDLDALENFDGRQTTYLVCSRSRHSPNGEPRLVKWPPSSEQEAMQQEEEVKDALSDAFSDSPVSFFDFRDLDLSMVVNQPRSTGTPDSDASIY